MKSLIAKNRIFSITVLSLLIQAPQASAGLFGSSLPKTEEYPQIQEIRNILDDIQQDSKKATLADCRKEIGQDLPNAIVRVDEHLARLDKALASAKLHVRNTDDIVKIAGRVAEDWNRVHNREATSGRPMHSSNEIRNECSYQAGADSGFDSGLDKEFGRILDEANRNVDACVNRLHTFKKQSEIYRDSLEAGSIRGKVTKEIKETDLNIEQFALVKKKIADFGLILLSRYSSGVVERTLDNSATIKRLSSGENKCSVIADQIATLERKKVPASVIGSGSAESRHSAGSAQ